MTTRISVRGFAVASATAVTTVGAVVGVAAGGQQGTAEPVELAAADATLLADIPVGGNTQAQTASLTQQADLQADAASAAARKAAEESARKQAAKDAADRKQAAEEAKRKAAEEAAKKREAELAASRSAERSAPAAGGGDFPQQASYTVAQVKAMAQQIVGGGQFQCFSNIVQRESTWNYRAQNPSSGAYGLVQALPGTKMASEGADWRTNPATQIRWGLKYMNERYGSPCGAWEFWQANHWY
ncbi:transglycosylase SLT domain-containing protein [Streptomyces durbertensis]|uniref:Transglycosylase SLT domain-containing protein n=1 Tax=Streptomyces durbertensis TaxID=2448886 RepID=A0ABR6EJZ8_9ACTN|nr:transglycosylase SLT domain-containing protein [Streptomyces durbertensis]MBB1245656.1 transglycosylase SLT domain-containing protein [Streptomyces durbertensis]